jgi:hypothetical protein
MDYRFDCSEKPKGYTVGGRYYTDRGLVLPTIGDMIILLARASDSESKAYSKQMLSAARYQGFWGYTKTSQKGSVLTLKRDILGTGEQDPIIDSIDVNVLLIDDSIYRVYTPSDFQGSRVSQALGKFPSERLCDLARSRGLGVQLSKFEDGWTTDRVNRVCSVKLTDKLVELSFSADPTERHCSIGKYSPELV